MNALLTGAASARTLLFGWIVPSLLFVSVAVFFLTPGALDIARLTDTTFPERSAILIGTAIGLGFVLQSVQLTLYRVLEGYVWPSRLASRAEAKQLRRRARHYAVYKSARDSADQRTMNNALEHFRSYPASDDDVMPTTFGNIIKAAETYGWDRYQLDVVGLWFRIIAVVGDASRQDEDKARANMDFQVCGFYLSGLLGMLAVIAILTTSLSAGANILLLVGACLAAAVFYRGAVGAAKEYGKVIEAITDQARSPLATSLGLHMPSSLERERDMWRVVGWMAKYPYTARRVRDFQLYRSPPNR